MLGGINLSGNVEKLLLPDKFPFSVNESQRRIQQALAGSLGHCVGAVVSILGREHGPRASCLPQGPEAADKRK